MAHVHCPKQFRDKMDSKSKKCYMIGYADRANRLWDPVYNKVILARDVIFNENLSNIKDNVTPIISDDRLVDINLKSDISDIRD